MRDFAIVAFVAFLLLAFPSLTGWVVDSLLRLPAMDLGMRCACAIGLLVLCVIAWACRRAE